MVSRKISDKDKKEIEILKRLSSQNHMIQLVGTYTHRRLLGILLYPVATCDLQTFFVDVEAWSALKADDANRQNHLDAFDLDHKERLTALEYDFPVADSRYKASPVYNMMGCLISAITYLHDERIRHKDLKPSNILLSRERLWLSDFGSATDFSMLSQSATDNERGGTPRYFSPEVAARQENGRASDVFSLGCVLLEIITLHDKGTRDFIRDQCSSDQSFHANLDQVDIWCKSQKRRTRYPRRLYYLQHVKTMLWRDPKARPTTEQLLVRFIGYDYGNHQKDTPGIFADCCKRVLVSERSLEEERKKMSKLLKEYQVSQSRLTEAQDKTMELHVAVKNMTDASENWKEEKKKASARELDLQAKLGLQQHDVSRLRTYINHAQHQAATVEAELKKEKEKLTQDADRMKHEFMRVQKWWEYEIRNKLEVQRAKLKKEFNDESMELKSECERLRSEVERLKQDKGGQDRGEKNATKGASGMYTAQDSSQQGTVYYTYDKASGGLVLHRSPRVKTSDSSSTKVEYVNHVPEPHMMPRSRTLSPRNNDLDLNSSNLGQLPQSNDSHLFGQLYYSGSYDDDMRSASHHTDQRLSSFLRADEPREVVGTISKPVETLGQIPEPKEYVGTLPEPPAVSVGARNQRRMESYDYSSSEDERDLYAASQGKDQKGENRASSSLSKPAEQAPPDAWQSKTMPKKLPFAKKRGFLSQFVDKIKELDQPPTEKWLRESGKK
ncbi:kinase-like domain-containing protein [Paraphoma chrysanthemicola]|nr:kinase-like domain-containing protein [Paraphoma chrysanthemicola]